jgi:hypothetical protein
VYLPDATLDAAISRCAEGLATPAALASIARDPYWPKWNSPWWQMTLLWELGEAARIPRLTADAMSHALEHHYLHFFPLRAEDAPGVDTARHGLCHCGVGTMVQVLVAAGIDAVARHAWIREWFLRYQLPDGGWNCDETAYLRATPRSSLLSTLPVLEALLLVRDRTPDEDRMLDRGAQYLIARRLCWSLSKDALADANWLVPTFPRFYFCDVLRGLAFVRRWGALRGVTIAAAPIGASDGGVATGRRAWEVERAEPGTHRRASTFELLERVSVVGERNPWLTRPWVPTP